MSLDEMAAKFRQIVQRVESGAQPQEDGGEDVDDAGDVMPAGPGAEDEQDDDEADEEQDEDEDGEDDLDRMRSQFQDIANRAQAGAPATPRADSSPAAGNTDPVEDRKPADPISPAGADREDRNPASPPQSGPSDPTAQAGALDDEPDGRLPDPPDDETGEQTPPADAAAPDQQPGAGTATPAELNQRLAALVQRVQGGGGAAATQPGAADMPPGGDPGASPQPQAAPGQPGAQPGALPAGYKPGSKEVWDAVVQRLAAAGHPLTRATVEQTLVGLGHDRPRVVAEMSAVHPQHVHGRLSDARKKMVDQTWGQLGKQAPTLPMQLGDVSVTPLISGPGLRRRRRRFQAVVKAHR